MMEILTSLQQSAASIPNIRDFPARFVARRPFPISRRATQLEKNRTVLDLRGGEGEGEGGRQFRER